MKAAHMRNEEALLLQPEISIEQHASSFALATKMIERQFRLPVQQLYALCRYVDDMVDEAQRSDLHSATQVLLNLQQNLKAGRGGTPAANLFLQLQHNHGLSTAPFLSLIEGVTSDAGEVALHSEAELEDYCYKVAGTVGELMCDILMISDAKAREHARALGMAMQLTNIARDVLEDAHNGRRYLPFTQVPLTPADIAAAGPDARDCVSAYLQQLLGHAEERYHYASAGFCYLPARTRFAIAAAATLYRGIGVKLANRNYAYWHGRVYLSRLEKARLLIQLTVRAPNFRL